LGCLPLGFFTTPIISLDHIGRGVPRDMSNRQDIYACIE
jgi:hypothetical protein